MSNRRVIFVKRPGVNGVPTADCFSSELIECPDANNIKADQCIVRSLFLSVDPALVRSWSLLFSCNQLLDQFSPAFVLRCRMNERTGVQYLGPWQLNQTVTGLGGVGIVEQVGPNCPFSVGQQVTGTMFWPWTTLWIADPSQLQPVSQTNSLKKLVQISIPSGQTASVVLSCLGLIGLTVLLGLQEKAHLQSGAAQCLVVSGAAGACGILTAQIGRLLGAERVVGICGSDEKCAVLVKDFAYDAAINYKTESDIQSKVGELCPNGVHVYFDNVGGAISESVILNMNENSHVVLCGQISQYNQDVPYPPPVSESVTKALHERNITRDRFLVLNYAENFPEALAQLASFLADGKLKTHETLVEGIERTGEAFCDMMNGKNIGKMIVLV